MAIANFLQYTTMKMKKVTVLLYCILLSAIVTITVLFLLFNHFILNHYHLSLLLKSVFFITVIIVIFNISFIIIAKVLHKQYYVVARSMLKVLKQYEKGNYTYSFSIDNNGFDSILKYMQKLLTRSNNPEESLDKQLDEKVFAIISVLISAMEDKDPYTSGHTARVAQYSLAIGKRLGLPKEKMRLLNHAAAAHDIGKIGIPIEIIEKNGNLSETEKLLLESHPIRGMKILSTLDYLKDIATIVMYHHERVDGQGYYELPGNKIPVEAKIIAVADALDAMLSDRPYRKGLSLHEAKQELEKNKGTQFDPLIVDTLIQILEEKGTLKELIAF